MSVPKHDVMPEPQIPDVDQTLIERLRSGDTSALESIFDAYFLPLMRFATRLTGSASIGEEIALDTLFALWERRTYLHVGTTIRAYLYRSVRNRALSELRARRRELARLEYHTTVDEVPAFAIAPIAIDTEVEQAEQMAAVRQAIASLPEPRRTIVLLRWSQQLSFAEIADVMEITEVSARAHVSRALQLLRALLRPLFEE